MYTVSHIYLPSLHFSSWEIVKDHVYAQNPHDINHMKSLIKQEFASFNDNIELYETICRSVIDRCQMCINTETCLY